MGFASQRSMKRGIWVRPGRTRALALPLPDDSFTPLADEKINQIKTVSVCQEQNRVTADDPLWWPGRHRFAEGLRFKKTEAELGPHLRTIHLCQLSPGEHRSWVLRSAFGNLVDNLFIGT